MVNSVASSVTARRRVVIHKALSADHDVTLAETSRRGHATRLAQSAARDGFDVVVVLGGDGTLNEAANGLAGSPTALATLPGGSTNVFARILGLPDDSVDATGILLEALAAGQIQRIGLGSVEGRYFLFHCGVGFDATVVEQVERRGPWKRWAGHPLFLYAAVDSWVRRRGLRQPPMRVMSANDELLASGYLTVVLNADPYTFLGSRGIELVPGLGLDEPLAAVTLERLNLRTLGPVLTAALSHRPLTSSRSVTVHQDVRHLTIESNPPVPYQVDGDYLGTSKRLRFQWTPQHLSLVVPESEG